MTAFQNAYREVADQNPEVTAALLVDDRGQVVESAHTDERMVGAATAFLTPLREFLDRVTSELGAGEFQASLIEGQHLSFALADVDGRRSVVVVGKQGSAPGSLRSDSLWLADLARGEAR